MRLISAPWIRRLIGLILIGCHSAFSYIHVAPNQYEVKAMVLRVDGLPTAIFNAYTRSPLKIILKGPQAEALDLAKPKALSLQLKILKAIQAGDTGEATLISAQNISPKELPRFVGNNLLPESAQPMRK